MDSVILEIFSNLNNSVFLWLYFKRQYLLKQKEFFPSKISSQSLGRQLGLILKEEHSNSYKVNFTISSAALLTNQALLGPSSLNRFGARRTLFTEWAVFLLSAAFWKVYSESWGSLWRTESNSVLKDWILNFNKCWAAIRTCS